MTDIDTLIDVMSLKDEKRSGQQLYNIEDPDTVAGHTWMLSLLTMLYGKEIDLERAIKMAVIHDIGESKIGDISDRADEQNKEIQEAEKFKMEKQAVKNISEKLENQEILGLWKEFEESETKEAKIVNDLDTLEAPLQALQKEKQNRYNPEDNQDKPYDNLDEFFLRPEDDFETQKIAEIFQKIREKYKNEKEK